MDEKVISVEELQKGWRDLADEVKKNRKLKFELFEKVFSETYSLLQEHEKEDSLSKCYIELIAEAYLFAKIEDSTVDDNCLAAFVLTERMLTYCAFSRVFASDEPTVIYIVDARREVLLDFKDVNESITRLKRVFELFSWKNK